MRILFYPRDFDPGDSQRAAVEMAGAMVRAGYPVTMLGHPGLLAGRARELGIEVIAPPSGTRGGVFRSVYRVAKVVRDNRIDVVHAFEWQSIAKAFIASQLSRRRVTLTGTVLSRFSPPVLPRTVPVLVGSRSEAADLRTAGYTRVGVLEPWVDTSEVNPSGPSSGSELKNRWGFDSEGLLITVATGPEGQTEPLVAELDAVADLSDRGLPVQLLVIGDGARGTMAHERARSLNERFHRTVVVAAGELIDRHEAFAAADVVIGSDGTLLEAMAHAKPVVIEGDRGYFRAVNHANAEQLSWSGWHGVGSGPGMGKGELLNALEPLLDSSRLREYRGAYSRELAERHGLDDAVARQLQEYRDALDTKVGSPSNWLDLGRVAATLLARRLMARIRIENHREERG